MAAEFAMRGKVLRDAPNRVVREAKNACLSFVPCNRLLYRLAKRYVDLHNGENNADIKTNGEFHFIQQYLPRCEIVFDIGANVGHWTSLALKINPAARVHCFEPSRDAFEQLQLNRFPGNVVCNNFGMSSSSRQAKMFAFDKHNTMNSLYARKGLDNLGLSMQHEENIVLDTVDRYCLEHGIEFIDLVKMDVEGHEIEVCKGMTRMLSSGQIGTIQFEYGGCNIDARVFLKDIFAFFTGYAYSFYKIYPKELRLVPRYDQRLENFQYQNWAIIKNDMKS